MAKQDFSFWQAWQQAEASRKILSDEYEKVSDEFDVGKLEASQQRTKDAVRAAVGTWRPGIRESDARRSLMKTLKDAGARNFWHPVHVRFGANTLFGFKEQSEQDPLLREQDIFFVDVGPVFSGYEGDFGETFVRGDRALYREAKDCVARLWRKAVEHWRVNAATGIELYRFLHTEATEAGWLLHPSYVRGHRLTEFPHRLFSSKMLGEMPHPCHPHRWVLEVQIRHPQEAFGAFYEDIIA